MNRWILAVAVVGLVSVAICAQATSGMEEPSALMLWVATGIGGVGGVLVVQALKGLVDKVLPAPIGPKAMYYVSWAVSFGFGIAAYAMFPEGRALLAKAPFTVFQSGSTVSALAAAIYKLISDRMKLSRNARARAARPAPSSAAPSPRGT
jgi:hypothetical protein